MNCYRWQARDKKGRTKNGFYLADTKDEVVAFVSHYYGYVVDIEREKKKDFGPGKLFKRGVGDKEKARFFGQMAILLDAGIPLLQALDVFSAGAGGSLQSICESLSSDLKKGKNLSYALGKQRKVFSDMVIAVIAAGELSGKLTEVLSAVASYFDHLDTIKTSLRNVSVYPIFLLCFSVAALFLFLNMVLPLFMDLYSSLGVEPSAAISFLFHFSGEIVIFPVLIAVFAVISCFLKGDRERMLRLVRKLPYGGKILLLSEEIRFNRIIALLLSSGLPLTKAVDTAAKAADSREMERKAGIFLHYMLDGVSISEAAAASEGLFSEITLTFIKVGEKSGTLGEMLEESAKISEQDLMNRVKNLKVVVEPVLVIFVAGVIFSVLLVMLLPMLSLLNNMPEF